MQKNKIIISFLILIIICLIGMLTFLFLTRNDIEIKKAKSDDETLDDDISSDLMMAEIEMFENPMVGEEIAVMEIKDYGKIKIRFYEDVAPKAVENFKGLAKNGYYNNVSFHRVIDDFMIQGGDPTGTGSGGESYFGTDFGPEYKDGYFPYKGTICMASVAGIENSLSSQFFIVQSGPSAVSESLTEGLPESIASMYLKKGGTPHLYKKHTVFGYVYEGLDIVDKIAKTQTDDNDKPIKDVIIKNIKIEEVKE